MFFLFRVPYPPRVRVGELVASAKTFLKIGHFDTQETFSC
jgi:hypothetical protein